MRNKKRIMPRLAKLPELGTKAAALEGCVDLIARMCGKPETVVRYWLDLYFQVRLAWAVEEDRIRREDRRVEHGLQVLRQSIQPDVGAEQDSVQDHATVMAQAAEASAAVAVSSQQAAEAAGELRGFEPIAPNRGGAPRGNANASDAAKFKRATFERLMRMREGGITIDQIVSASRGNLTDDVVLNILQARKMSISYYRKLAAALDKIEA